MAFGRLKSRVNLEPSSPPRPKEEYHDDGPHKVSALLGGSGVSLDGQSLILPDGGDQGDDVSSINTSTYDFKGDMRILGTMNHDEEIPPVEPPLNRKSSQAQKHRHYEHKTNYSPKEADEKSMETDGSEEGGCLPLWITEAPTWLKLVIVLSTALLVGAIVLIGVGAALAMQDDNNKSGANTGSGGDVYPAPTDFSPPVAVEPTTPVAPTTPPAAAPAATSTTRSPAAAPAAAPISTTDAPVAAPTTDTAPPAEPSTLSPTAFPSNAPTSSTVTFFVLGGRFTGDSLDLLPEQLPTLPNLDGDTVMFHLGDWNSPFATSCVESSYEINEQLYQTSAVPVYFVPGDNEFNDCPNPEQAFGFWYDYNLEFETKHWPAPTAWNITRQEPDYPENFCYLWNRLLIIGINLVGGVIHDSKEWSDRWAADLQWINDNYALYGGQFESVVILAHADPSIQANADFFTTFYVQVETDYADTPVIFIHRNLGVEPWGLKPEYNGISNLIVVVVEGSIWPPMLVQIDVLAGIVDIDQESWYTNYMDGELRV